MGDSIFARYLDHIDQWGEVRDRQLFDDMWTTFRRCLCRELTKRDLWRLPPSYLGIFGVTSWTDEAIDDLAHDGYLFVIHERKRALLAQMKVRREIDGLIIRNIRNFLFETQKKRDPLGFRIYELLQLAVREIEREGDLELIAGDQRIRNTTILRFSSHAGKSNRFELEVSGPPQPILEEAAMSWCDEILPEIVTVRGPAVSATLGRLRALIRGLPSYGLSQFRFGDLVDAVKTEARIRWTAITSLNLESQNPILGSLAAPPGEEGPLSLDAYQTLLHRLEQGIQAWPGRSATRDYLSRLLVFLAHHALEADDPSRLPSSRFMSENLNIPRGRFKELFAILKNMTLATFDSLDPAPVGSSAVVQGVNNLHERASP